MTASPITFAVSRFVFPLHERLKGHDSVAQRRALERSQWWSPEELSRFRVDRLRRFLVEAKTHVTYYRHLFAKRSFDPAALKDLTDLARIPLLDKQSIRMNLDALKSDLAGP